MNLGLEGKTAFVAGASSGLGFAVAAQLVEEGCNVAICSRSSDRIEQAANRLNGRSDGNRVLPLVCDVTIEEAISEAVRQTVEMFGSLSLLVTNAGGPPTGQIDDFSADEWRNALDLNLVSTINLTRHALPQLRRAAAEPDGFARVLMISSLSAKQPIPSLYLSNVSRAGVQAFAKSLSEELGPSGITVNTILPGYTRTDRLKHLSESLSERSGDSIEAIEAGWAAGSALKRIGTESEFAHSAVYLLSGPAGFITGAALCVDGGAVKSLL